MDFLQRLKKSSWFLIPVLLMVISLIRGEDPVFALLVFASEAILAALFMWIYLLYFCRTTYETIAILIGGIIITAVDVIMCLAALVLLLLPVGLYQAQQSDSSPFPSVNFMDAWLISAEQSGYSVSAFHELVSYFFSDLWYVLLLIPLAIELINAIRSGELRYVKGTDPAQNKTLIKHMIQPLRKSGQLIMFSLIAALPVFVLASFTDVYWVFVLTIFLFRLLGELLIGRKAD
ncbi:MAG: hypothetical protein Fur0041_06350 [Bacteroidia bacterium]